MAVSLLWLWIVPEIKNFCAKVPNLRKEQKFLMYMRPFTAWYLLALPVHQPLHTRLFWAVQALSEHPRIERL